MSVRVWRPYYILVPRTLYVPPRHEYYTDRPEEALADYHPAENVLRSWCL